jgi:hypothetical protein
MRLPFACSFLVLSAAVLPGLSAGCDCEGTPRDRCTSSTECPGTEICTDGRCGPAPDAPSIDAPRDVASLDTPPLPDTNFDANCIVTACLSTEGCGDGFDEDCDGMVDEDCACVPGSTARCLPGRLDPSVSRCSFGEMACEGAGEFGSWGACSGGGTDVDGGTALYGCRRIGILGAPGALASSNFQAWLETQGAIATRIHETALAPTLRREELDTFDLVVIDWLQRTYSTEEAMTLSTWVREGGALFAMTGHDSGATADRHVSLLSTLGPNYDLASGPINGPATLVAHPTTLDTDGVSTLPPVTFTGGLRVTVPAALAADIVTMAVIGDQVVGAAGPLGDGFVLLFGDEWIEFDSEWASMPPIPRFWENSVRWLAPDEDVLPACE